MLEAVRFAKKHNVNIEIKPLDGSYRPGTGYATGIVILKNGEKAETVTILNTSSNEDVENMIMRAVEAVA